MKTLFAIPVIVGTALLIAASICRIIGVPPHARELVDAAIIAVVAAEAGLVPSLLIGRQEPSTKAQVALGGTVVHLILTIFMAVAVMTAKVVESSETFVFWLTAAYWASLAALCWSLVKIARVETFKPTELGRGGR